LLAQFAEHDYSKIKGQNSDCRDKNRFAPAFAF
jgi:hypothetical protein